MNIAITRPTITLEAPRVFDYLSEKLASAGSQISRCLYRGLYGNKLTSDIRFAVEDYEIDLATFDAMILEVAGATRERQLIALERRILGFLESPGFDHAEDGEQLSSSIPETLAFLAALPNEVHLPDATLSLDGSITLEWELGTKRAAATFEGDEDYGYAYYRDGAFAPGVSSASIATGLPQDLREYMTS